MWCNAVTTCATALPNVAQTYSIIRSEPSASLLINNISLYLWVMNILLFSAKVKQVWCPKWKRNFCNVPTCLAFSSLFRNGFLGECLKVKHACIAPHAGIFVLNFQQHVNFTEALIVYFDLSRYSNFFASSPPSQHLNNTCTEASRSDWPDFILKSQLTWWNQSRYSSGHDLCHRKLLSWTNIARWRVPVEVLSKPMPNESALW